MKKFVFIGLAAICMISISVAQTGKAPTKAAAPAHQTVMPGELQWNPFMPGVEVAVVAGDPDKAGGIFTIRIKTADGVKIPPHWHPTTENVTVLQGTFLAAMGEKFDEKALKPIPTGGFISVPKEMRHFASAKGVCIVQVHGEGPFKINWVNPEDDPANKAKTTPAKKPAKKE